MTGPEHFVEAERLLTEAAELPGRQDAAISELMESGMYGGQTFRDVDQDCRDLVSRAQVHATLALGAATALGAIDREYGGHHDAAQGAWRNAVGIGRAS